MPLFHQPLLSVYCVFFKSCFSTYEHCTHFTTMVLCFPDSFMFQHGAPSFVCCKCKISRPSISINDVRKLGITEGLINCAFWHLHAVLPICEYACWLSKPWWISAKCRVTGLDPRLCQFSVVCIPLLCSNCVVPAYN